MGKYGEYDPIVVVDVTALTDVELLVKDSTGAGTRTKRVDLEQMQELIGATAGTNIDITAGVVSVVDVPSFVNLTYGVYTIADGGAVDIDPANGAIQVWTLGANRTPTATNFASGQAVTLMIDDGTAYAVTWSTIGVVWVGGSAPTLPTSGYGVMELWKVGSTVYGAAVGDVAAAAGVSGTSTVTTADDVAAATGEQLVSAVLLESGDNLLLEDGSQLLLEA